MHRSIHRFALVAMIACSTGAAAAQTPPLSAEALARCAGQVQSLRAESARLNQKNQLIDDRRNAIEQGAANLATQAHAADTNDLKTGLARHDQLQRHNQNVLAFNAEVEQLKREIVAVNAVKLDYDRGCSNRPYRRADLERLPETARNAMRAGMADVVVPYLDPAASALPLSP